MLHAPAEVQSPSGLGEGRTMKYPQDKVLRGRSIFDVRRDKEKKKRIETQILATPVEHSQSCQTQKLNLAVKTSSIAMGADLVIRSPAQRARRFLLSLFACFVLAIGAYVQIRTDRLSGTEATANATAATLEHRTSAPATLPAIEQDQEATASVQLSVADNTASGTTMAQRR